MIEAEEVEAESGITNLTDETNPVSIIQTSTSREKPVTKNAVDSSALGKNFIKCILSDNKMDVESMVFHIKTSVRKASSPALTVSINGKHALAIIDEGSELNCIDLKYAKPLKSRLRFQI